MSQWRYMERESQVCELVESDPLGDNGKVGLGNKLLAISQAVDKEMLS